MQTINLPRNTAWFDWEEWNFVFSTLYCGDLVLKRSGLEVVSLWKTRGKLSHSAESTAQLVEVKLQYVHRFVKFTPLCEFLGSTE